MSQNNLKLSCPYTCDMSEPTVLITGASGLVGNAISSTFLRTHKLLTPSHKELDITNNKEVAAYITRNNPTVIIHAAAFTDNNKAEGERGDKKGMCWRVNVEGTKNIVEAADKIGAYVIYISTGSVFAGDDAHPGPFTENDATSPESALSWYAWTKAVAESLIVSGAIIRLSHPVSKNNVSENLDYIHRIVKLYDEGKLYPLFTDQLFPITYIEDVITAIATIIGRISLRSAHVLGALRQGSGQASCVYPERSRGTAKRVPPRDIYHIASRDSVSPYELARYAIQKARGVKNPALTKTTFDAFVKGVSLPKRYAKYCAIDGSESRKRLKIPARSWREIVDCLYPRAGI